MQFEGPRNFKTRNIRLGITVQKYKGLLRGGAEVGKRTEGCLSLRFGEKGVINDSSEGRKSIKMQQPQPRLQ